MFPTFGFTALKWTWFFDFNQSYIGSGMICPHIVNWSMVGVENRVLVEVSSVCTS